MAPGGPELKGLFNKLTTPSEVGPVNPHIIGNPLSDTYEKEVEFLAAYLNPILAQAEKDLGDCIGQQTQYIDRINALSVELTQLQDAPLFRRALEAAKRLISGNIPDANDALRIQYEQERSSLVADLTSSELLAKQKEDQIAWVHDRFAQFKKSWLPHLNS